MVSRATRRVAAAGGLRPLTPSPPRKEMLPSNQGHFQGLAAAMAGARRKRLNSTRAGRSSRAAISQSIRSLLMPRHTHFVPRGVIPAVLLPFHDDLSIDEKSFRSHLRDVAATDGISAITINAHSTEVASCSFDEQRRVLKIAEDEVGARLPLINGVWADGSLEA